LLLFGCLQQKIPIKKILPQRQTCANECITKETGEMRIHQSLDLRSSNIKENNVSSQIKTSSSSTTAHLAIVQRVEFEGVLSKNNSFTGHIDTQSKSRGGYDDL